MLVPPNCSPVEDVRSIGVGWVVERLRKVKLIASGFELEIWRY